MAEDTEYASDTNDWWLTEEDLRRLVDDVTELKPVEQP